MGDLDRMEAQPTSPVLWAVHNLRKDYAAHSQSRDSRRYEFEIDNLRGALDDRSNDL